MFAEEYGEIGIDYIHVHHICPVASKKKRLMTDAKNDRVPVCPHCLEPMGKVGGESRGDVQVVLGLLN
jgi:predicted HNH restriction endonuclease